MSVFESNFKSLGFYVEGEKKQFVNGRYSTTNDADIKVLETLPHVVKVEEPKAPAQPNEVVETEQKAEATEKKPSKRKSSAK